MSGDPEQGVLRQNLGMVEDIITGALSRFKWLSS